MLTGKYVKKVQIISVPPSIVPFTWSDEEKISTFCIGFWQRNIYSETSNIGWIHKQVRETKLHYRTKHCHMHQRGVNIEP